jgi:hypothetical protein
MRHYTSNVTFPGANSGASGIACQLPATTKGMSEQALAASKSEAIPFSLLTRPT